MKTIAVALKAILAVCALATVCSAQIEFVGYMMSPQGARYVVKKVGEEKSSAWLGLGDSYLGFKLLAHDPERETLSVEQDGARMELPLKAARVVPVPPWKNKIQGTRIRFLGEPPVSEDAVREMMKVRGDTEVDAVALDRDLRTLYRTGHFETIEFKLERVDANTSYLLVILQPKPADKKSPPN